MAEKVLQVLSSMKNSPRKFLPGGILELMANARTEIQSDAGKCQQQCLNAISTLLETLHEKCAGRQERATVWSDGHVTNGSDDLGVPWLVHPAVRPDLLRLSRVSGNGNAYAQIPPELVMSVLNLIETALSRD